MSSIYFHDAETGEIIDCIDLWAMSEDMRIAAEIKFNAETEQEVLEVAARHGKSREWVERLFECLGWPWTEEEIEDPGSPPAA